MWKTKILSFNAGIVNAEDIEKSVNLFLETPNIIVDPMDIHFEYGQTTVVSIVYKLKNNRKNTSKNYKNH